MKGIEIAAFIWVIIFNDYSKSLIEYIYQKSNSFFKMIFEHITCWKCLTFWTTITLTHDIYTSCIGALFAYVSSLLIEKWEK